MSQAKVMTGASGSVATEEVELSVFGDHTRRKLLRAALLRYEGNLRQGTHSTKTRAEVAGTGRKPFRQKGTGRARAGDYSSPLWKGGGTIFGPKPRSYRSGMPVKARREALRSALLAQFLDGNVAFLRDLDLERPSTKTAAGVLRSLEMDSAVVVLPEDRPTIYKSFRNLPRVDVVRAAELNARHVLQRQNVVFVDDALAVVEERLGPAKPSEKAASND